jgi:hypothetical protein
MGTGIPDALQKRMAWDTTPKKFLTGASGFWGGFSLMIVPGLPPIWYKRATAL